MNNLQKHAKLKLLSSSVSADLQTSHIGTCKNGFSRYISMLAVGLSTCLFASVAQASSFFVNTMPYYYQLPKPIENICYEKDNCPEVDISYLNSDHAWANKIVNTRVNAGIIHLKDKAQCNPTVSIHNYEVKVAKCVEEGIGNLLQDWSADVSMSYSFASKPEYKGHIGNLELFEVAVSTYMGGAHGSEGLEYVVLDATAKKQLTLADVILKGKKSKFEALVYNEFRQWVENDYEQSVADYEASGWKFRLSDNFTFNKTGINILYQQYEIGPYAVGMPEFTIPYQKLQGVLKPKYLF